MPIYSANQNGAVDEISDGVTIEVTLSKHLYEQAVQKREEDKKRLDKRWPGSPFCSCGGCMSRDEIIGRETDPCCIFCSFIGCIGCCVSRLCM